MDSNFEYFTYTKNQYWFVKKISLLFISNPTIKVSKFKSPDLSHLQYE